MIPGSRHDYFRLPPDAIKKVIQHGLEEEIKMFRVLSERSLDMIKDLPSKRKTWLKEMQSCYSYLENCFPSIMAEYDANKKR